MIMLLCASKFSTAKIECSFKMGKQTPFGVPFILLLMVHKNSVYFIQEESDVLGVTNNNS